MGSTARVQFRACPPVQHPAQQRCETGRDLPLDLAGRNPVGPVVEPLPQVWARGVPAAFQGLQGTEDRVPAAAVGQDGCAHPQGQALDLAGTQMGQMLGDALGVGIECRWKKQGRLPVSL